MDNVRRFQDDVQCSTSLEMGRRKLPSIPTQRAEKVSETPPAPVYLTSSAPTVISSSPDRQYHPYHQQYQTSQDQRAYSRPVTPRVVPVPDLTQQPSPSSAYRTTVDPAILPGATIIHAKSNLPVRQTTSAATGGRASAVLTQPVGAKMPSPLARVLLKKELKEVLERRRESLEACEIEANQRQYTVHRMLITGLLPEYRPADIDNIPNVIPCLLPIELISGARIVPPGDLSSNATTATTATTPVQERLLPPPRPASVQSETQEVGVSTDDFCPEPKLKSVGTQSETSVATSASTTTTTITATPYTAIITPSSMYQSSSVASTSLRRQIEHGRFGPSSAALPRLRTAETQTNGVASYESQYNGKLSSGRRHKSSTSGTASSSNQFSASEPNLLESTAKYFAEYDRQLREHGRRMKNRFAFTDDDSTLRESRKQRIMDELAQRREKISSLVDLRSPPNFLTIHPTSDYSSTVPHYGSLPRIDFPTTRSPRLRLRDYTSRGRSRRNSPSFGGYGYGSLPRNYERFIERDYVDAQDDLLRPLPNSGRCYDALSRSWQDLNQPLENAFVDPQMRLYSSRATNYLNPQSLYPRYQGAGASFGRPVMKTVYDDLYTPPPAPPPPPDYVNTAPSRAQQHFEGHQSLSNADIISQYANYLSNQFISDQQKLMNGYYPANEPVCGNQTDQHSYSATRYGAPNAGMQSAAQPPVLMDYHDTISPQIEVAQQLNEQQMQGLNRRILDSCAYGPLPPPVRYAQARQYDSWPLYQQQPTCYNTAANVAAPAYRYSGHQSRLASTLPNVISLPGQVYSRNDTNYGSRPTHYATEYGNYYRNRVARQLEDVSGQNYVTPNQLPYATHYQSSPFIASGDGSRSVIQPSVFMDVVDPWFNQPYTSRAWSSGNLPTNTYDAVYPKEDVLSRMYSALGNSRTAARMTPQYGNISSSLQYL
ncbi:unnamed protein product [Gongylonema pulchrum]|uniref:ANK_REP_REGION domain-containing protein n=1 Tax=Gongylonema pulchrum TaxID=637853 RepID=A0A183E1U6_9BILA|nr:unnamed protein product [Gongylonema pulchrum]